MSLLGSTLAVFRVVVRTTNFTIFDFGGSPNVSLCVMQNGACKRLFYIRSAWIILSSVGFTRTKGEEATKKARSNRKNKWFVIEGQLPHFLVIENSRFPYPVAWSSKVTSNMESWISTRTFLLPTMLWPTLGKTTWINEHILRRQFLLYMYKYV